MLMFSDCYICLNKVSLLNIIRLASDTFESSHSHIYLSIIHSLYIYILYHRFEVKSAGMDQQLSLSLSQLDLKVEPIAKEPVFASIEENPFYEPYKHTDLVLWKRETDLTQLKLKTLKKKNILRKPILQRLQSQSQNLGKKWLEHCKSEMETEITWVNFTDIKKSKGKRAYSMSDLRNECDKIPYEMGDINIDSLFVPKRMSEMAETMYS